MTRYIVLYIESVRKCRIVGITAEYVIDSLGIVFIIFIIRYG